MTVKDGRKETELASMPKGKDAKYSKLVNDAEEGIRCTPEIAPDVAVVEITKESKDEEIGVTWKDIGNGIIVVSRIHPKMKGAKTKLQVGMVLVSLNGINVCKEGKTAENVTEMIGNIEGTVKLTVEDDSNCGKVSANLQPPPGFAHGGDWGSFVYRGPESRCASILCCFVCGLLPFLIVRFMPFDISRGYKINGGVYDANGEFLGLARNGKFSRDEEFFGKGIDSEQRMVTFFLAGFVGLIMAVLFFVSRDM